MFDRLHLKKNILFWILPVLVLSTILTFFSPFWYIASVKEVVWENGVLYGVDEWDGKLRLFGCDANGHNAWIDTIYTMDDVNTIFYSVSDIEIDENGICNLLLQPQEVTDINNFLYLQYDINEKQIIHSETIGNNQQADVYAEKKLSDGIWTVTADGSVWLSPNNGEKTLVFSNNGEMVSQNNTVYTFGNDGLYFYNADDDKCYVIDYTSKQVSPAENIPFAKSISSYGDLYSLNQMEDGTWTATFYTTDGKLSPMVVGKSQNVLVWLSSPPVQTLKKICMTAGILLIAIFSIKLIVRKIRRTFPTALKIICFSIPMLLVFCFGFEMYIQNFLKDDVENRLYTQMYYTASSLKQQISTQMDSSSKGNVDSHNILYAQYMLNGIYDRNGTIMYNTEDIVGNVSVFGYENNSFYSRDAGSLSCASSTTYGYPTEEAVLQDIVKKKTPAKSIERYYNFGRCLSVYYPILENQEVVGVIRVIYPEINITYEMMDELINVVQNIFVFLLVMIVFLTIICFLLLRPLKKIKHALTDFSVGIDLDEPPKEGNGTEIKEMTNLFYHMTINIREHLQHIDQLERAYEPYIPQSLISLLGENDIRDVTPADETTMNDAAILIIDAQDFAKAVSKAGPQEMFQFVNRVLQELTASVEDAGGTVIQFTDTGLYAFFPNNPDQALQAAIAAQKALQSISLTLAGKEISFGSGIVCGDLRIGIIGDEERMEIRAVSSEMMFAQSLQKISSTYHLGVLIDEDTMERLDQVMENIRLFGFINDAKKQIYEIFDGQKSDIVMLKSITKADFEAGVRYFQAGAYTMAKDCFIRVLRKNKDDLAAGRYLLLCGEQAEMKEKGRNLFE